MSSSLANHYLRPEDLSPLPTTLDAKKSPLALLAQTCSNIGADILPNNNKPIILPLEKPRKSHCHESRSDSACSDKNTPIDTLRTNSASSSCTESQSAAKISFKPYETNSSSSKSDLTSSPRHGHSAGGTASNTSNNAHHQVNGSSHQGDSSRSNSVDVIDHNNKSRTISSETNAKSSEIKGGNRLPSAPSTSSSDLKHNSSSASSSASSAISYSTPGLTELAKTQLTTLSKGSESLSATGCKTSSSSIPSSLNGYNGYHSLAGGHDLLKASPHYAAAAAAALSPYMSHHQAAAAAAIRGHSGSVCRDPYCKGCQLGLGGLPCANGCSQCVHPQHSPHPYSSAASLGLTSLGSHLPAGYSSGLHTPRPFVCNWTVGGSYCGKTFGSCEELLQHLKTHTGVGGTYPGLGYYSQSPTLPHSMAGLRSSGLDPLRYHPYKIPSTGVPGALPAGIGSPNHMPSIAGPGGALASYYPSYSLYNGRL